MLAHNINKKQLSVRGFLMNKISRYFVAVVAGVVFFMGVSWAGEVDDYQSSWEHRALVL
jgi:hypothetical protein